MCRRPSRRGASAILIVLLAVSGVYLVSGALVIKAKAQLAPALISQAWERSLALGGEPVKPWPWADTWPVGRLQVPAQAVELFVLAGDTGNALAFGPGHSLASAPLGAPGQAVVGGHRDTHFAFLRDLPPHAEMRLQLPDGQWRSYRVTGSWVVNAQEESLSAEPTDQSGAESLLLVTCYPFGALFAGGPLRYVVRARPRLQETAADPLMASHLSPRGYTL